MQRGTMFLLRLTECEHSGRSTPNVALMLTSMLATDPAWWDGFWGNLVGAGIGALASLGVALVVLFQTRSADDARAAEQRAADMQLMREQIEASAERDRHIARERASLDAAESITSAVFDCLNGFSGALKAGVQASNLVGVSAGHFNILVRLKAPALDDDRLREIVEEVRQSVEDYWLWCAELDELEADATDAYGNRSFSSDDQKAHGLELTGPFLEYGMDCLTGYRMGRTHPRHVSPPVLPEPKPAESPA